MNSMTGKGGSSYDTKKKLELDPSTSEELEKLAKEITSQSRVIVAKMKTLLAKCPDLNPKTTRLWYAAESSVFHSAQFENAKNR